MNYKIISIYKIFDTEEIQRVINEKLYRIIELMEDKFYK